ncbi:sporulation protein YabP [Selenihalanaerobacter shriftii]|uniref:Sporulation protein YabP n=1 Tax=Selenihalanaerobacter shriftii TaxID=142842 RepID=A0A1T4N4J9_9FIRM|nr:sporulation protein YabP [Selenihalanaerobacter shriftii]SJZ73997.1 sporulation protein YabP [Selenihalanaerobacter shriftii]
MSKHQVKLSGRELIEIFGVIEVINFSEVEISLATELGSLYIKGEDLNIKRLNLDDGELIIEGYVIRLDYSEQATAGGFLGNLFK